MIKERLITNPFTLVQVQEPKIQMEDLQISSIMVNSSEEASAEVGMKQKLQTEVYGNQKSSNRESIDASEAAKRSTLKKLKKAFAPKKRIQTQTFRTMVF